MRVTQIRAYEGRNIYSHYPVVAMLVDLGRHDGRRSNEISEFNHLLLAALPGLRTHHCASARPGGFSRRLDDGTFLGHVIEHVALELQSLAGWSVVYGKTRQTPTQGTYNVVFECGSTAGGLEAGHRAVSIVRAAAAGRLPEPERHLEAIKRAAEEAGLGPSTAALAEEAIRRGIAVRRLGQGSLLVLGNGCRQRRLCATVTSRTCCPSADLAADKILTKEVLASAGIPVPAGILVTRKAEAVKALSRFGPSVAVKPVEGNQGRGVCLNLATAAEVRTAYGAAASQGTKVMVERYVEGRHYRLLVVDGRVVATAERRAALVTGDGRRTVIELVEEVNRDPRRGNGHQKPLSRMVLDTVALLALSRQGLTPESVPEAGRQVILRENGNLSTGGTARDATNEVHPETAALAVRAARVVGLDLAGVDIVTPDIGRPLRASGGAVIEVNAAPGLRMHLHPCEGSPRDVVSPVLDSLFAGQTREPWPAWLRRGPWGRTPGRIPVVAVTGTNGKTTIARLVAHILGSAGLVVGLATTDGAWVGSELLMEGDCAGPKTAATILNDPAVEAAVLETARGGIIRDGLAFDRCDVGLVTNISPDHEGQDGLERLEDLAFVKALVIESVHPDGHAVLNADDPFVHSMADRASGTVVFFTRNPGNVVVRKHLLNGGKAVYVAGGTLVADCGGEPSTVVSVDEVPLALGGSLPFHLENAVASVAATWGLGVPMAAIRRGLRTFGRPGPGFSANPGRFQAYRLGRRVTVVLDYGHNRVAYNETLAAARRLCRGDLLAVIGAPGDRRDDHLFDMGREAARLADHLVIKEDADTRGRARGEVAAHFLRGVLDTGLSEARVEIVFDERLALERAVSRARPGDWVIVFYEKKAPLVDWLESRRARAESPRRLTQAWKGSPPRRQAVTSARPRDSEPREAART